MNSGTGKLEIDLNDFWEFIHGYINGNFEIQFGVPKINNENQTLEVDYLFNTECHPTEEMNYLKISYQLFGLIGNFTYLCNDKLY
jgi:hypothetical protein